MARNNPITAADALTRQADRAGENVAASNMDKILADTKSPKSGDEFIETATKAQSTAFKGSGVTEARGRLLDVGKRAADAQDFVAEDILQQEKQKARLGQYDEEIDRLTTESFRILPMMMARTDILDPAKKRQLAQKAIMIHQNEIRDIGRKKKEAEDRAVDRANSRVGGLQAKANILNKELEVAKTDLNATIDLFNEGNGTAQDIIEAAVRMDEANKKRSSQGDNPYVGGTGNEFSPDEIALFQYFEEFGEWAIADSSSKQVKAKLVSKYMKWRSSGRPGGDSNSPVAKEDRKPKGSALSGLDAISSLASSDAEKNVSEDSNDEIDSIIDDIVGG